MGKIIILVATQKANPLVEDDIYMPIHVGSVLSNEDLNIQRDDDGDNISDKNPYYCELTALYWAWKNLDKDIDYVGLCHYRRYFDFSSHPHIMKEQKEVSPDFIMRNKTKLQPPKSIYDYDGILPVSRPLAMNAMTIHILNLGFIDMALLEKIILDLFPDYEESLRHVFYHERYVPQRNMFVMKRHFFDEYCQFLFSVLFEVERHIKYSPYKHLRRSLGFMGELLLPLFCYHKRMKVCNKQILLVTDNPRNTTLIRDVAAHSLNKLRFFLNNIPTRALKSKEIEPILRNEFPELFN